MDRRAAEEWLFRKLQQLGVDVYVDRQFDSFRDRLADAIRREALQKEMGGRRGGKPESFRMVFYRIYGVDVDSLQERAA